MFKVQSILFLYISICILFLRDSKVSADPIPSKKYNFVKVGSDGKSTYTFGNKELMVSLPSQGHVDSVLVNKEKVKGNFRKQGALFNVTLLENVYGLDDGKRRTLDLHPVAMKEGVITLKPENENLPQFTFTTIDKGSYLVIKLLSMQNPKGEHAIQLTMNKLEGTDWLPLDSVTKKTRRRGNAPNFFGVLQRSNKNPLGSIAIWGNKKDGEEFDEMLYKIWTTEDIPHPKVDGEWTVERAKAWNAEYAREIHNGNNNMMIIGPRKPEDLRPLVDVNEKFGMKRIYMHLNTWGGRYWADDKDNLDVNREIFPNGTGDMVDFANYLHSKDMKLTFRTVSYALTPKHPEYLAKGNIDPRLASWWQGTLAEDIDPKATQITVAEGREHFTHYNANRRWAGMFNMRCMQIGNELVLFDKYVNNGDGTWTLQNCKRGFALSEPESHKSGELAKGLYRIYGQAMAPDPDSTMMEEMAQRFGEFHNKVHAGIINFDAMEVQEMMYYYGDTKFTGEVYRHMSHPLHGSTSGPELTWGYYEPLFHSVRNSKKKCDVEVPKIIPYSGDMKIGLHKSHWSASSPYAYVWAVPGNAAAGREIGLSAQAGFHDVTMDDINKHGLVDHYAKACRQWGTYGFTLPKAIKRRIFSSFKPNGRYSFAEEIFRMEGEGESLSVTPFRMMKREGIDKDWCYHQEHGTTYPYQYIRPSDVLKVKNAYGAQVPEFIIRVMPDFSRDITSLRSKSKSETEEETSFNDMLDKFQGASGVAVEEEAAENLAGKKISLQIMPDLAKVRNKGNTTFIKENHGVRISIANDTEEKLDLVNGRGESKLPAYGVKTDITKAGGLGMVVTGDGSGAILVVRISGQGIRDYLVHLDFKGKRYIEIPSPQVSWTDARWPFTNAYKRWRGNSISTISLGIDRVKANSKASVLLEDLRFLPEKESALVNPTIQVDRGTIAIEGTIPSDHYLWYQGGDKVGVYDLNWNKLHDLPVTLTDAEASSGEAEISVTNQNRAGNPWLEVQFFVKDKPMLVGETSND